MEKSKVAVAASFVALLVTMSSFPMTVLASTYSVNAVWIQDASWVKMNPNILTTNLTKVVDDLSQGSMKFAFVFGGYWNADTSTIMYNENDYVFMTVINALHAVNIKVLAWVENDGAMNLSAGNRQNLYDQITNCMNKGFDGYNDDIEEWDGTLQNWIDYENNCTTVLHGLGKLMTADVALDWQQNTNQYLHMDYIVSMLYSNVSTLESSQAAASWQEDFGEYQEHNTPPASPMIMGIMNYYGNQYLLTWQLEQVDKYLMAYEHPQLVGFCLWLYEYMGTHADDWSQWNNWIVTETSEFQPFMFIALLIAATLLVVMVRKKTRLESAERDKIL
jgi:hypothetical protein